VAEPLRGVLTPDAARATARHRLLRARGFIATARRSTSGTPARAAKRGRRRHSPAPCLTACRPPAQCRRGPYHPPQRSSHHALQLVNAPCSPSTRPGPVHTPASQWPRQPVATQTKSLPPPHCVLLSSLSGLWRSCRTPLRSAQALQDRTRAGRSNSAFPCDSPAACTACFTFPVDARP